MHRIRSREVAMELIYQMEIQKVYDSAALEFFLSRYEENLDKAYIDLMMSKWMEHRDDIEKHIETHLKGWKIERISKLDLAILRLAVTEMLYDDSIPAKVSINEAVNLAKKFVDEKSGKFINGVLSHFVNEDLKDDPRN
jgi:N utilization substance protein B